MHVLDLADLFEEASALLKSSEDVTQTAENLRKVMALSSNYNTVKAWQAMAAQEAAQSALGIACADLQVMQPALPSFDDHATFQLFGLLSAMPECQRCAVHYLYLCYYALVTPQKH